MGSLLGKVICVLTWLVQYGLRGCIRVVRVPSTVAAMTIGLARAVQRKRDARFALVRILRYEAEHIFH